MEEVFKTVTHIHEDQETSSVPKTKENKAVTEPPTLPPEVKEKNSPQMCEDRDVDGEEKLVQENRQFSREVSMLDVETVRSEPRSKKSVNNTETIKVVPEEILCERKILPKEGHEVTTEEKPEQLKSITPVPSVKKPKVDREESPVPEPPTPSTPPPPVRPCTPSRTPRHQSRDSSQTSSPKGPQWLSNPENSSKDRTPSPVSLPPRTPTLSKKPCATSVKPSTPRTGTPKILPGTVKSESSEKELNSPVRSRPGTPNAITSPTPASKKNAEPERPSSSTETNSKDVNFEETVEVLKSLQISAIKKEDAKEGEKKSTTIKLRSASKTATPSTSYQKVPPKETIMAGGEGVSTVTLVDQERHSVSVLGNGRAQIPQEREVSASSSRRVVRPKRIKFQEDKKNWTKGQWLLIAGLSATAVGLYVYLRNKT